LDLATSFAHREVTPDLICENAWVGKTEFPFWEELIGPLRQMGRHDLADAVCHICSRYLRETGWRGALRRFDRQHLNSAAAALKRALWPTTSATASVGASLLLAV